MRRTTLPANRLRQSSTGGRYTMPSIGRVPGGNRARSPRSWKGASTACKKNLSLPLKNMSWWVTVGYVSRQPIGLNFKSKVAPHKERLLFKRSRHHGRSAYPGPCGEAAGTDRAAALPGGVPLAAGAGAVTTSWSRMLPTFRGSAAPLLRRPPDMSVHLGIEASFYIYVCTHTCFIYMKIYTLIKLRRVLASIVKVIRGIVSSLSLNDTFLYLLIVFSICLHPSAKSILMLFKAM